MNMCKVQVRSLKRFALFVDGSRTFERGRYDPSSQCYICHIVDSNSVATDNYMIFRPYDLVIKL